MVTGLPAGPGRVGVSIADVGCGMNAYTGVLEALIERQQTGRGKGLRVSLFDAVADWMNVPLLYFEGTGKAPQRLGLAHPSICPYGAFATNDGALVLISIQNEREWVTFCASFLDDPALPKQPGFESNNIRVANRAVVDARVGQAFAALTRDEAAAKLRASNTAYGFVTIWPRSATIRLCGAPRLPCPAAARRTSSRRRSSGLVRRSVWVPYRPSARTPRQSRPSSGNSAASRRRLGFFHTVAGLHANSGTIP